MAFSPCPESERRKLETERIDPATYQLRKPEAVYSGERDPSGAKGKPELKMPGNEDVPPEVLERENYQRETRGQHERGKAVERVYADQW